MNFQHLSLVLADRLATVHLARPEARNALSQALMRELLAVAHDLADRSDIDVVLLAGDARCFSAGADLRDASRWDDEGRSLNERREIAALGYKLCKSWEELPQISIVAIEGYAVGGGLALALACDWRVLADDAFVSLPEVALGIPLTWGAIPRLVSLVGPARAKRLTILCERLPAAQALVMGLVDYLTPPGQALRKAHEVAVHTLSMPAAAVRMSKQTANAVATAMHHAAGHMAHDQLALAAASDESRLARAAALKLRV